MRPICVTLQMEGITSVCWHRMAACGAPRATGTPGQAWHTYRLSKELIPCGFAVEVVCLLVCGFGGRVHRVLMSQKRKGNSLDFNWTFSLCRRCLLKHSPSLLCSVCVCVCVSVCVLNPHVDGQICSSGTEIRCCCICSWCQLLVFPSGQVGLSSAS